MAFATRPTDPRPAPDPRPRPFSFRYRPDGWRELARTGPTLGALMEGGMEIPAHVLTLNWDMEQVPRHSTARA